MILSVLHKTVYRYAEPVRGAVQSLRLTPSVFDGQRTLSWNISVSGGIEGGSFRDGAGDWVQGWSVRGPVEEVTVMVEGQVEVSDQSGVLRGHREIVAPEAYLRETGPTRVESRLEALAREAAAGARDELDIAHRLMGAVGDAIAYRPGATEAHTTAAEAMALGEGVCQDHAHAMIAAARVLDIPGRFVSGYLLANDDGTPHEAAHAWAELWIPSIGWIGFDPANTCCPDARYVRLGSGFDAQDAAPIRGMAQGMASEDLDVMVAVQAVQQ